MIRYEVSLIGVTSYGLNEKNTFHVPALFINCIHGAVRT